MKKLMLAVLAMVMCVALCGCGLIEDATPTRDPNAQNPVATITMDDGRVMTAELYPEYAPNTVANFVELANSGFYDGILFHRVIDGFVIQAGMAMTAGREEVDYTIKGEMSGNNFKQNTLIHEPGVLSMARVGGDYNSASSQFYICTGERSSVDHLDGEYAAFGKLSDEASLNVALKLATVATNSADIPINDQKIKSIRVETFGQTYTVEKIK